MPRAGGAPLGGHSSGSFPAAQGTRVTSASDNRVLWIALGVVAVVALAVILVVSLNDSGSDASGSGGSGGSGGSDGYTAAVESNYVEDCVEEAGEGSRQNCQCTYDYFVENVSFERFSEIDRELVSFEEGDDLPDELLDAVAAC
jgi:hypothetical protein